VRILYLTPGCFDKGGISRYCRYQIAALREIVGGDQLRVLSLLGPDEDSFEEPFDVTWHGRGSGAVEKVRFVARTLREALGWGPTALWCAHVNMAGLARAVMAVRSGKVVLNTYGLEVWSGFRRDARWGLQHADFSLSDCHATADYLEAEGLRPPGTVAVVWDCVDINKFSISSPSVEVTRRYGIPDPSTGVNILTLGRMAHGTDHKGYSRLYEAFGRIAAEVPEARLIYAGRGELAEGLRGRAAVDGLSDRVFFTGGIHEADLPDIYRCAQIFSLVSDRGKGRGEGIPLTPLEAAACGVPILVGNQDGSREAVIESVNGHILDPFDLDRHSKVLLSLIKDGNRRKTMGLAARKRIEEEFAYPTFREKHQALLAKWFPVMGGGGGPATH
jgi:phosphatidylinositol alpha-1,6-mannosyltransferase